MRAVKMFVAGLVGLAGMTMVGAPAEAKAKLDPDEVRTVTKQVRVVKKLRATPIPEGTSYYCAVGVFVSFNDVAGFAPTSVAYQWFGDRSESIGPAPYDDKSSIDGIAFPPVGGKHQTQLGDYGYSQGGHPSQEDAEAACEELRQTSDDQFGPTATISYQHTPRCKGAITNLLKAKAKVKAAQKRLDKADTPREKAAARSVLKDAQTKLKAAQKKYKAVCQ